MIRYTMQGLGVLIGFSYVFYHSVWPAFAGSPFLFFYWKKVKRDLEHKRKEQLRIQFKDSIVSLAGMLRVGYSVENAMKMTEKEMESMWGEQSDIVREFRVMVCQMEVNKTAEEVWQEFAKRSSVEEIEEFAQIFSIVKRSGGELSAVIQLASSQIHERFLIEEQIRTQTASRRLEQKIMNWMPIAILLYVGVGSPDLLEPMYQTAAGRIVMTISMGIYMGACVLAGKMAVIEV